MPRISQSRSVYQVVALAACLGSFSFTTAADAQHSATPRHIGVLLALFSEENKEAQAFRQGLRDAGYAEEGRDLVIEWRDNNRVYMTGGATEVFHGKVQLA